MKKLNKEKLLKYRIPVLSVVVLGMLTFSCVRIYHYEYVHHHAEHARIVQAQNQPNLNIYKKGKK